MLLGCSSALVNVFFVLVCQSRRQILAEAKREAVNKQESASPNVETAYGVAAPMMIQLITYAPTKRNDMEGGGHQRFTSQLTPSTGANRPYTDC
jgi:hypothetical protein